MEQDQLDNPVWAALQGRHAIFAEGTNTVKRYNTTTLSFLGFDAASTQPLADIAPWVAGNAIVYAVGLLPALAPGWQLEQRMDCAQMVCEHPIYPGVTHPVELLGPSDHADMLALTHLVQPGYFLENTPALGRYFGIKDKGKLVAIAGERMALPAFTEVSAVCTHPDYTGRGYAQQLVAAVCRNIIKDGFTPVLHVVSTNARAIGIYERLGFRTRRGIPFWRLRSPAGQH